MGTRMCYPGGTEVCGDGLDNDCDGSPGACRLEGELQESASVVTDDGLRYDVPYSLSPGNIGDWNGDGLDDIFLLSHIEDTSDGSTIIGFDILSGPFDRYEMSASSIRSAFILPSGEVDSLTTVGDPQQTGDNLILLLGGRLGRNYAAMLQPNTSGELTVSNGITPLPCNSSERYLFVGAGDTTGDGTEKLLVDGWNLAGGSLQSEVFSVDLPLSVQTGLTARTTLLQTTERVLAAPLFSDINADGISDVTAFAGDFAEDGSGLTFSDVAIFLGPFVNTVGLSDADTQISFDGTELVTSPPGDADADGAPDIWLVADERSAYSVPIRSGTYNAVDEYRLRLIAEPNAQADGTATPFGGPGVKDIDEDGSDDVVVTRPDWYSETDTSEIGKVYFLYGPLSGSIDLADADATVTGSSYLEVENLGYSMLTGYFDDQDGLDIFLASYVSDDVVRTDRLGLYTHDW